MRKLFISMFANFYDCQFPFLVNQANFLFGYKVRTTIIVLVTNQGKIIVYQQNWTLVFRLMLILSIHFLNEIINLRPLWEAKRRVVVAARQEVPEKCHNSCSFVTLKKWGKGEGSVTGHIFCVRIKGVTKWCVKYSSMPKLEAEKGGIQQLCGPNFTQF